MLLVSDEYISSSSKILFPKQKAAAPSLPSSLPSLFLSFFLPSILPAFFSFLCLLAARNLWVIWDIFIFILKQGCSTSTEYHDFLQNIWVVCLIRSWHCKQLIDPISSSVSKKKTLEDIKVD